MGVSPNDPAILVPPADIVPSPDRYPPVMRAQCRVRAAPVRFSVLSPKKHACE
jgi:hypothetical protein